MTTTNIDPTNYEHGPKNAAKENTIRYSITGQAAHQRIAPLLPSNWIDCSSSSTNEGGGGDLNEMRPPDFIWENAPRYETKPFRDTVKCYSHLPNGISVLDDKWALARLFSSPVQPEQERAHNANEDETSTNSNGTCERSRSNSSFASLESHCFRGPDGFQEFWDKIQMNNKAYMSFSQETSSLPDLLHPTKQRQTLKESALFPQQPKNLWVIKDANSNGAGGIWIVDPSNYHKFLPSSASTLSSPPSSPSPLIEDHRYVAQRYAWPPVLYGGRKCHVRVYALMCADGRAYVHKRAFLHVANEVFDYVCEDNVHNVNCNQEEETQKQQRSDMKETNGPMVFDDSVHITNCCANSHDTRKFSGEICADLDSFPNNKDNNLNSENKDDSVVPLAEFFPSISASVAELTKKTLPFVQGGEANNGFEYMGLDFILSYRKEDNQPIAYLLEVNCPPSQDTATGLPHAEDLHNDVIRDVVKMWIVPNVLSWSQQDKQHQHTSNTHTFGWKCVFQSENENAGKAESMIAPSKAAILNKIRWAIFERKASRLNGRNVVRSLEAHSSNEDKTLSSEGQKTCQSSDIPSPTDFSNFARSQYPYFSSNNEDANNEDQTSSKSERIFLENAGGSQVPEAVIKSMVDSLSNRHRSLIGNQLKADARKVLLEILGASETNYTMFLGPNATALLEQLAQKYVDCEYITAGDEVIIASENHLANVEPWTRAVDIVKGQVKWWLCTDTVSKDTEDDQTLYTTNDLSMNRNLNALLTDRTKVLCLSHASNIIGDIRQIKRICIEVKEKYPQVHIIVDGVASAAHHYANVSDLGVDWYVISCHKLFGPHIGGLCGQNSSLAEMFFTNGGTSCIPKQDTMKKNEELYRFIEKGTINYEGCAGIIGLGKYLTGLALFDVNSARPMNHQTNDCKQVEQTLNAGEASIQRNSIDKSYNSIRYPQVQEAYKRIRIAETCCLDLLLERLQVCQHVRILKSQKSNDYHLPIVSFIHSKIDSKSIVDYCFQHNIFIREGKFLANTVLLKEMVITANIVRVSFCHYNTLEETNRLIQVLESIDGWH